MLHIYYEHRHKFSGIFRMISINVMLYQLMQILQIKKEGVPGAKSWLHT